MKFVVDTRTWSVIGYINCNTENHAILSEDNLFIEYGQCLFGTYRNAIN